MITHLGEGRVYIGSAVPHPKGQGLSLPESLEPLPALIAFDIDDQSRHANPSREGACFQVTTHTPQHEGMAKCSKVFWNPEIRPQGMT